MKNGIRTTLGASKVRSQWFDVEFDGKEVVFTGKGFGHGIGMSQNGATILANEGYNYKYILRHYYSYIDFSGIYDFTEDTEESE